MYKKNKLNIIQIIGLVISGIGLLFIAMPQGIGAFALRLISFVILIIGFYGFIFASQIKSTTTVLTSFGVLLAGFYAFIHPESVLFLMGIVCLISGLNSLFVIFRQKSIKDERSIISAFLLLLLGVFASLNSEAALETVVFILGIVLVFIGIMIFVLGNKFKILGKKMDAFYSESFYAPPSSQSKQRVVVRIESEEVEEIDYKEL